MESSEQAQHEDTKKVSIEIIETKLFAPVIAEEIQASIHDALELNNSCSLVLAGGSTPSSIYRILGRPSKDSPIDWSQLNLFLSDERWVPAESEHSNYRMIRETLLSQTVGGKPVTFPVNTSLGSVDEAARDYSAQIAKCLGSNQPCFDIVLLGVGEDGHTASLFPGESDMRETNDICIAVDRGSNGGARVSLSMRTLLNAKRVIFMVKGEGKAEIVRKILEQHGEIDQDLAQCPASCYRLMNGRVSWFLDTGAASKLTKKNKDA